MRRRNFSLGSLIGFLAIIMAGEAFLAAVPQEDLGAVEGEIAKAWQARDFPRILAVSPGYLAAVAEPGSPRQMAAYVGISGAETVAGRPKEAADHLNKAFGYLARAACQAGSSQHEALAAALFNLIQNVPPEARGHMQVMLTGVWEDASRKSRGGAPDCGIYQGFSALIAAGLAQLYYLSGADSVARTYAAEAVISSPPVEPAKISYGSDVTWGCIKLWKPRDILYTDSERPYDEYIAYARSMIHRFTHPPRAMALMAAAEIFMKIKDAERLRRAAFAIEELLDHSLTTGSLKATAPLNGQILALHKLLKEQFGHLWPAPKAFAAMSREEADGDPRLGKSGPSYTKRHVQRYGGESGRKSSFDYWPILLKASLPARAGKVPTDGPLGYSETATEKPLASTLSVPDRAVANRPWWLYALEDGKLRVVGRAIAWNVGKKPDDPWEFRVERLALGNLWSVNGIIYEEESREPVKLLGPVYVSQELLGPDFEDLPPHRQKLFLQGLPWVGMSARLMRVNLHACQKAIMNWTKYPGDFQKVQVISCAGWTVFLDGGRVTGVVENKN